jgi:hypothetical protein
MRGFDADAGARHLEDHGVVNEAVDGSRSGHRILEGGVANAGDAGRGVDVEEPSY